MAREKRMAGRGGSYLAFLVLFGCVCLTATGNWGLYAEPLQRAGDWCMTALELPLPGERPDQNADVKRPENAVEAAGIADGANMADQSETGKGEDATAPMGDGGEAAAGSDAAVAAEEPAYAREPVYQTVEDDYFADAVFIGDSRTVGMYEYGGLEDISAFYCSTGLTVYKMFTAQIVETPGQKKKQTVEEALSQRQFSNIYLMIGINEMGTGTVESFTEAYRGCVEHLRELQPDARIYLQGIMKVTSERSAQGDYITNEGIEARNAEIAKLADNVSVFYLDVNPVLCDESGGMTADYTYDGVHLKAQYIALWKDYLKTHVASFDP